MCSQLRFSSGFCYWGMDCCVVAACGDLLQWLVSTSCSAPWVWVVEHQLRQRENKLQIGRCWFTLVDFIGYRVLRVKQLIYLTESISSASSDPLASAKTGWKCPVEYHPLFFYLYDATDSVESLIVRSMLLAGDHYCIPQFLQTSRLKKWPELPKSDQKPRIVFELFLAHSLILTTVIGRLCPSQTHTDFGMNSHIPRLIDRQVHTFDHPFSIE